MANGKVRSFWLNGTHYDWEEGCYHPMSPKRMWHDYKFEKISPGVYKYEKHSLGHGDPVMESGSATSTDG